LIMEEPQLPDAQIIDPPSISTVPSANNARRLDFQLVCGSFSAALRRKRARQVVLAAKVRMIFFRSPAIYGWDFGTSPRPFPVPILATLGRQESERERSLWVFRIPSSEELGYGKRLPEILATHAKTRRFAGGSRMVRIGQLMAPTIEADSCTGSELAAWPIPTRRG
jgi:hypothetical protein